jgi:hypothetical protein
VTFQTASYLIAALSFAVTCAYYIMNLSNSKKNTQLTLETRQAQLFKEFLKTQESYEFSKMFQEIFYDWTWSNFDDFMAKYGKSNIDARTKITVVFGFFEGLGIMVRRGLINSDLVYEFNYNSIIGFWERYSPIVSALRQSFNSPQFYEPIEWLYGEMKRLQVAKGHGFDRSALK